MAGKLMLTASLLLWAAVPGVAYAASESGNGGGVGELGTVVLLVVMIGVAYVLAHNVVERLQRRFLVVSGAEYLLLGVLLGLSSGIAGQGKENLLGLFPVIALAAGWVGLLRGTDFDFASSDYIVIPGVIISMGLMIIVSLMTAASPEEKWGPFFQEAG